jgi:AcrR family transcriptional regulator
VPRLSKGPAASAAAKRNAKAEEAAPRVNGADKTRANIIEVATSVFARKGLSGARVDEIADLTHTSKRMIYYYFGSKEALYEAVLAEAYTAIRSVERELDLDTLPALDALDRLVRFTFDYENGAPEFIRLIMVENIHQAVHLKKIPNIRSLNSGAIDEVRRICERGVKEGTIRADVDPIDLHMSISALCFFNVSNRSTFSTIFDVDM